MVESNAGQPKAATGVDSTTVSNQHRHRLDGAGVKYTRDFVMFEDLYDRISMLWSPLWPVADGVVTEVISERLGRERERARLAVAYEFSVGSDGPYTGECFWTPAFFPLRRVSSARRKLHKRVRVRVRYRPDDPSVNTLDGGVASLLKKADLKRSGALRRSR
jgi:hypothetical protein